MTAEDKAFADQLTKYADAIAGFSVVQSLGVVLGLARGDCFTKNVLEIPAVPMVISVLVTGAYFLLTAHCHQVWRKIWTASASDASAPFVRSIEKIRYALVIASGTGSVVVMGLIAFSNHLGRFQYVCR